MTFTATEATRPATFAERQTVMPYVRRLPAVETHWLPQIRDAIYPAIAQQLKTFDIFADAQRAVHGYVQRAMSGYMDTMRAIFTQVIDSRRLASSVFARFLQNAHLWAQPASVKGLEDQLKAMRRRSYEAAEHAREHLRSLLLQRDRTGAAPGQLIVTHPQVTRGPNTRQSSHEFIRLAGFSHA